jgi:hypothetical protein
VRHDESHPADDAGHGDAGRRRERRRRDDDAAAPRAHAERARLVLGQCQQVDAPRERREHASATPTGSEDREELA